MPIFPQTFTDDKPIYYPQTWSTGKTAPQLYEELKLTPEFFIMSNLLQCIIAGGWVWFISVLCSALYEMWKLHKLQEQSRIKLANRQYISRKFIMSIGFISFCVFTVTITLLTMDEFMRYALIKGYFFYIGVKWSIFVCKKGKQVYAKWKQNSDQYEEVQKDQQQD